MLMKRLKGFIIGAEKNDDSYRLMYEGPMYDALAVPCGETVYESVYWSEDAFAEGEICVGYEITKSRKYAPTLPTVTVYVPYEVIGNTEDENLKRLKHYLLGLTPNDQTYKSIYEGKMTATLFTASGTPMEFPEEHADPVYYENDADRVRAGVAYEYTQTNKLQKDVPTVKVRIPAEKLGDVPLPETDADEARVKNAFSDAVCAAADFCARRFSTYIDALNRENYNRSRPDKENGAYYYPKPGGEVLARNTAYFAMHTPKYYENGKGINVYIRDGDQEKCKPRLYLCFTLQVQLPQKKHDKAMRMLCRDLPGAVAEFIREFDRAGYLHAVELAQKQAEIRAFLRESPYCAFIANGSILPRDRKTGGAMAGALPFTAPKGTEIEIAGVRGMGIRRGVTVITGGGYSGKSTVLDAVACGVYNHCLGDGRELVITDETAVSIAAEDGRAVTHLNISPFIKWLPGGDTKDFSTVHASGSTSQAANIMEAAEYGARLLLIDEDRSATNFMIRDRLMKELIRREPITPFTDRVRELAARGISTILVIGGSGEYLAVADHIFLMDEFVMYDATDTGRGLAKRYGVGVDAPPTAADWTAARVLQKERFSSYPKGSGSERLVVSEMNYIVVGDEAVDLRGVYQLLTDGQRQAAAFILRDLMIREREAHFSLSARLDEILARLEADGLDSVYSTYFTECGRFFELPRKQDIAAAVARMRHVTYFVGNKD